ncbi:MAG: PEGA domain-containing protein [Deltaproteobacteria bacterium]|jgi:hypothetical protein|nr:PEGA domain-containing protein [Deltaproteobacteria bacterium]MBW2530463.1 PEGA domain-containing protein [Deltaproteobacteria bacterium]
MEARLRRPLHVLTLAAAAFGALLSPGAAAGPATGEAAAEVVISDEARQHFQRGVELLEASDGPHHQQAYEAFRAAYRASPSPKILSNLGLCAMALERDGEAIESFQRYLAEVPGIDPRERAKLERDLQTLEAGVAPLQLQVQPAGATVLDERLEGDGTVATNRYGPLEGPLRIGIRAGLHRIVVELEGHEPATWQVEAKPGEPLQRTIELAKKPAVAPPPAKPEPPPPQPKPKPAPFTPPPPVPPPANGGPSTGFWVMLGVTGALGVGAGVVGGLALQRKSTYVDYQSGGSRVEAESIRDQGEALNITTDVLLGATAASAVVTVVLLLTGGDDESAARRGVTVSPAVADRRGGAVVTGTF